jgi:phosphatidylglycerophosphate synthase
MLDTLLRRPVDGVAAPLAARLRGWKVRADALTLARFAVTLAAMTAIGRLQYGFGLAMIVLAGVLDVLDGAVARGDGETAFGAYLDLVLGLIGTAGVAFAFALAQPDRALAAMFLMLGLLAHASSDIGAARDGTHTAPREAGQLVDKSVLTLALVLACLLPFWFSIIAYGLGIACFVTAGSRMAAAAMHRS